LELRELADVISYEKSELKGRAEKILMAAAGRQPACEKSREV